MILTAFLTPLATAFSFGSIVDREREYYAWMNALLLVMLGVFISGDLLLFYVFFELTLIPMFFIIGIWGGPQRRYAAAKFFLFTFTGSVFTLAAAIYVGIRAGSFYIPTVISFAQHSLTPTEQYWVLLGFIAGFAVKTPLFPVHTWLPLAHTEAPTAGSVILAGVLLKLGTYGLLRLAVPIGLLTVQSIPGHPPTGTFFPVLIHFVGIICIIGVIYAALVAWVQPDIKKLVAYSSVSHLGFCVLGLFALNDIGMQGSILYMINHGLSTGAMFLVIGMIYDRYHTRDINELSGLAKRMPILAFFFVFFVLASIGLPGLNGFWSEFWTILGAFTSQHLGPIYGAIAALGIILGAVYMLHMTARVIWGPLKVPVVAGGHGHGQEDQGQAATPEHGGHGRHENHPGDIGFREISVLVPIAIAVIILGVKPGLVIDRMLGPVQEIRAPLMQPGQEMSKAPTPPAQQQVASSIKIK
jgi:NADH-quinone oxidoreductase subunit M